MPTDREPITADSLLAIVDRMADRPVALFADLVADRFITGSPKRISREAPVLILRHEGEHLAPGGGANAAANVAALGGVPRVVGVVGDDANGRDLLEALREVGIATDTIHIQRDYATPTKTRVLGGDPHGIKQQIVRFDIEQDFVPDESARAALDAHLATVAAQGPAVAVLSDYGYGAVDPQRTPRLRQSLGSDCQLLCDSRFRLDQHRGIDGATPNEEEACALLGDSLGEDRPTLVANGRRLRDVLAARWLLITRGSRGMTLFEAERALHLPVHGTDQVADVTGAGDTVIGTFALALAAGATPAQGAVLANYAGGVVVMKMGTAVVHPDELREAVSQNSQLLEALQWDA
ncbi:MAG: PfkB family carbohydrate kinase [Acidobacteriota bacterium]